MEKQVALAAFAFLAAALLQPPSFVAVAAATAGNGSSSCTTSCGNISIEYPFGVEKGCYHPGFDLNCNHSYSPPRLFLGQEGSTMQQVLEISIPSGTLRINSSRMVFQAAYPENSTAMRWEVGDSSAVGGDTLINSCITACPVLEPRNGSCSGIGCCQTSIAIRFPVYDISATLLQDWGAGPEPDEPNFFVYIVDQASFHFYTDMLNGIGYTPEALPAILDWFVLGNSSACSASTNASEPSSSAPECRSANSFCKGHNGTTADYDGYRCYCSDGYEGNPYVLGGCRDIDECKSPHIYPCYGDCNNTRGGYDCQCHHGYKGNASILDGCEGLAIGLTVSGGSVLLLLGLAAPFIVRKVKLQRIRKMRDKFFMQNHGLLLQQLISRNTDFAERTIITLQELEMATNNFDKSREVGDGGHGVVYKGILDLHVVAIKKSKIVVQKEIDEFINEVAILSQVNHRNVVKLLGCCLETKVPLLVYEFISNGTLYHHLNVEGSISLPWNDRLRIALEVARALSYLHSAVSMPIFHRDIKSSNILLDDNLIAKVSDFGASRYISINETGITTAVQGTIGYLDPMYYYTGRLPSKSDVFSFGVLLMELLTRKKPVGGIFKNGNGLVSYFVPLLLKGNLFNIIDSQVKEEEDGEVLEVTTLATTCTKFKGEERSTMREVEMALESIISKKGLICNNNSQSSSRPDKNRISALYMSIEGVTKDKTITESSMEEEILLSSSFSR